MAVGLLRPHYGMSAVVSHPRRIQFSNDEATWLHAAQSDDSSSLDSDPVLNIVINCIKNLEHEIIVKEPQNVPSENNLRAVLDRSEIQLRSLPKNMLRKKIGTNGIWKLSSIGKTSIVLDSAESKLSMFRTALCLYDSAQCSSLMRLWSIHKFY